MKNSLALIFISVTLAVCITESVGIRVKRQGFAFPDDATSESRFAQGRQQGNFGFGPQGGFGRQDGFGQQGFGQQGFGQQGFGGQQGGQQVASSTQRPAAVDAQSPAYLRCIRGCQTTNEYNPICGSDNVTYSNRQRLGCAVNCGNNIQMRTIGACPPAAAAPPQ